jgi:plasmid stabilization system protein ParE
MIIRYTDTALDEIDGILSYIARENPNAAVRVASAIERAVADIEEQPQSAPIIYDRDVRAKLVVRYPYRIFYMLRSDELIIRNVRSTRRQLPWRGS